MLVFIDESGDPGLKISEGSSRFFTVSMVIFEDDEDAVACDRRIERLKAELGYQSGSEFHFKRCSDVVRRTFLTAVAPYNFFYYGFSVNKDPGKLWGEGFKNKDSFYKYTCRLVFENAKEKLINSTVIIDKAGNLDFKRQLERYLKSKMNEGPVRLIKYVKMQRSESNNLLQLADFVAGVINRSIQQKKRYAEDYRRMIAHREISVRIWPK